MRRISLINKQRSALESKSQFDEVDGEVGFVSGRGENSDQWVVYSQSIYETGKKSLTHSQSIYKRVGLFRTHVTHLDLNNTFKLCEY